MKTRTEKIKKFIIATKNVQGVYLLRDGSYVKVGRSKDIGKRMKAYTTHNPNFIPLGYIETPNGKALEKQIKKVFVELGCKKFKKADPRYEWLKTPNKDFFKLL